MVCYISSDRIDNLAMHKRMPQATEYAGELPCSCFSMIDDFNDDSNYLFFK